MEPSTENSNRNSIGETVEDTAARVLMTDVRPSADAVYIAKRIVKHLWLIALVLFIAAVIVPKLSLSPTWRLDGVPREDSCIGLYVALDHTRYDSLTVGQRRDLDFCKSAGF